MPETAKAPPQKEAKEVANTSNLVAIGISVLALGVSAFTAYKQYWPDDETRAILSYANFSIQEGRRLGKGPRLIAAISFVNRGNRPVILSKLTASYGYNDDMMNISQCEIDSGIWTGLPWEDSLINGEAFTQAVPRAILPQVATTTVYAFEAGGIHTKPDVEEQELMACLAYEIITADGIIGNKRWPIGIIKFSSDRIIDVTFSDNYRDPIKITP